MAPGAIGRLGGQPRGASGWRPVPRTRSLATTRARGNRVSPDDQSPALAGWHLLGEALLDRWRGGSAEPVWVRNDLGGRDPLEPAHFFRGWEAMPPLEREALERARGRVLDLGAGAGAHALVLQERGVEVTAVDALPQAVQVLRERGLRDVRALDWRAAPPNAEWDTILLLMNGPGIAGTFPAFRSLLGWLRASLRAGGQVLLDSTTLPGVLESPDRDPDGHPVADDGRYPGELHLQLEYGGVVGEPFPHLFVDDETLLRLAAEAGFTTAEVVARSQGGAYLARLAAG